MADPGVRHDPRRAPPALFLPPERRSLLGMLISVALHAGVVGAIAWRVAVLANATPTLGTGRPGPAGGGGGGRGAEVTYIQLPPAPAASEAAVAAEEPVEETPVAEEDVPLETPDEIVEAPPEEAPPAVAVRPPEGTPAAGAGTGSGAGQGTGTEGGSGSGSGGGTGTGEGVGVGPGTGGDSTGIIPPSWRFFSPPLERPPRELRGQTILIRFWVRADGTTERFETEPEIANDDYRRKFAEIAMATRWRPARRRDGTAVPAVAEMQVTLPSDN